ncbi:putative thioredoxin [Besnoitia besnoiti]|uniref:protein disulfide-isomerase n=1 Tax=Besnoitia besnoiti TaxID=94643 RepID=A0A2A9MED0_BESBE|nr:putative thioredoxin [Besnoitia besnoiti]PFH33740.1 putative thioredoxin [Besnoitia besnoiti]
MGRLSRAAGALCLFVLSSANSPQASPARSAASVSSLLLPFFSASLLRDVSSSAVTGAAAARREAGVVNVEEADAQDEDARGEKAQKSYTLQQRKQTEESKSQVLDNGAISLSGLKAYKAFLESHPFVFVMYYAPWCYWSKATMPEFHAAAKILAHHDPPVILALVDSVEEEDIANFEDIREFPTLRFFIDGRAQAYHGRRHRTHLVHWVDTRLDRDKSLTSADHLDELVMNREYGHLVIIGAFPDSGYDATAYVSVARQFGEDVFFGHVQQPELIDHLRNRHIFRLLTGAERTPEVERRVASPPFIVVFSKNAHEPDVHVYAGNPSDVASLTHFASRFRFPLISVFDADRLPANFFSDPRPKAAYIINTKNDPGAIGAVESETSRDPLVLAFIDAAKRYRHALLATVCGNTTPFEKHMLELLGVDEESLPAVRIMSVNPDSDGRHHPALKYRPEEPGAKSSSWGVRQPRVAIRHLTPKIIGDFFDAFARNDVEPYFRSEAVAEDLAEPRGAVKTVVGATFKQIVMESDEDVFIEFYAPWCGYCRKLEPAYKELAARLRDVTGLTVAKIDATRNEVPSIKVSGYPTLFLFPRGKKDDPPQIYSGDRTVKDMLEWLEGRVQRAKVDARHLLSIDLASRDGREPVGSVLEEL